MVFGTATADGLLSRRRVGRPEAAALFCAAIALVAGAAAWVTDTSQSASLATAALPSSADVVSFQDRFVGAPSTASDVAVREPLDRSALAALELKFASARGLLARELTFQNWHTASVEENNPSEDKSPAGADIPLPRSRPATADAATRILPDVAQAEAAPQSDNRSLFQKLSDLMPGGIKLASLTPESGLFHRGPDLAALGYGSSTAVYDISARAVYLPNGMRLEAHSGLGKLRDDPEHVSVVNLGATPPATYELKPRERLFHGVRALRMLPIDGTSTLGRDGLLTHPYMLGPNGDSNGCVSIRDYDSFLKAFDDGQFNRLVVVPSLNSAVSASQHSTSQS